MIKELNFMGARKIAGVISILVVLTSIVYVSMRGVQRGVQFVGGTEIQVQFRDKIEIDELRKAFKDNGFSNATIVRFEEEGKTEFIVKIKGDAGDETKKDSDVSRRVDEIFKQVTGEQDHQGYDVNKINMTELTAYLKDNNPANIDETALIGETETEYTDIAKTFIQFREDKEGFFMSMEEALEGFEKQEVKDFVSKEFYVGSYLKLKEDNFSPSISSEQTNKAVIAMAMALLSILVYVTIRFKTGYAIGAIAALVHDVIITLGFFVLFNQEFTLPVVAAFLTIIGYSLNDTIVVFDRMRENLALVKNKSLLEITNRSLNQTISRTLLTSLTTLFVVVVLFFFGGIALKSFSFPLLVGIIVGTYSSLYVATPIFYIIESRFNTEKK